MNINTYMNIMVFIFGLVFGSFFNVVGYRVPNNMSISFPSSHCPNCNHKLKFYELIPVFSYIFLRGKCLKCKEKISIIYPLFELITGLLFLLSYLVFGNTIKFIIAVTFISVLIIITISDIKYFIIPDQVLIIGFILLFIEYIINIILNDISIYNGLVIPLLSGIGSFASLYLLKLLADFVLKKESLGGGDIKLMFLIGFVLGFDLSFFTLFIASVVALPISLFVLIKKKNNVLPFGPYISIGAIIIMLLQLNIQSVLEFLTF